MKEDSPEPLRALFEFLQTKKEHQALHSANRADAQPKPPRTDNSLPGAHITSVIFRDMCADAR